MELRKISYFLKIVECGSLSKAARSLNLSQPTLSRFLDNLETDVGVKLVTRSKSSSLVLTKAGMDYVLCSNPLPGFCPENNISDKLTYFSLNPPFYYNQAVCYPKNTELTPAKQYLITLLQNQPKTRILD